MTKKSIKVMLEESKKAIDAQQEGFAKEISGDLSSFKKKALDRIR